VIEETKSTVNNMDLQSMKRQTVLSDSKISVSDMGGRGSAEYRANELSDPDRWDYFGKRTDVYAIGVVMGKMVGDLKVSHELQEAIKAATDGNVEGRISLLQLRTILKGCLEPL
jgi:hypothetical protein